MLTAEKEEQRFVTITHRTLPVDVVAPEHEEIDAELNAWGRWSRERGVGVRTGSAENAYRAPWRQWHYPTTAEMMPSLPNPRMREIDRAVLRVPERNRMTIRLHYVEQRRGETICRRVLLRHEKFAAWMRDCRCMVLNQLRFLGA